MIMTENNYERRNALNNAVKFTDWLFNFRNDIYNQYIELNQTDKVYYIQAFDKQNKLDTETLLLSESECRRAEKKYRKQNLTVNVWIFTVRELDEQLF